MSSINGPPYHNEFFLEANGSSLPKGFPETRIDPWPPESRIYTAALIFQQAPQNNLHSRWREGQNPSPPPEWIKDHRPVSISYRERRGRFSSWTSSPLSLLHSHPCGTQGTIPSCSSIHMLSGKCRSVACLLLDQTSSIFPI